MKRNLIPKPVWVGALIISIVMIMILAYTSLVLQWARSDVLSLAQLFIGLVGFPLAIYGFFIAAQEFAASQQLPEPDLYWELEKGRLDKQFELLLPPGLNLIKMPWMVLKNQGKSVTSWYLIRFDLPKEFVASHEIHVVLRDAILSISRQSYQNWHYEKLTENESYSFMSNGEFALYPNYPQRLCKLSLVFEGQAKYPKICNIPFAIYSDKGKEIKGKLTIKLLGVQ